MSFFYHLAEILLRIFTPKETEYIRENQMLLHPGIPGARLTKNYYVKKLGSVLAVLTAGTLLSIVILILDLQSSGEIENYLIERGAYGEGEKNVSVDVFADGEMIEKQKILTVDEKQYTSQEIKGIFYEMEQLLPHSILGENSSVDHIDHDLLLINSLDGYPVSIEWLIGDYDVLDSSGHIQETFHDDSGCPVKLTAGLSYKEYREDYEFFVRVFPKYRSPEDRLSYDLDQSINTYALRTVSENDQILPDSVDGQELTYEKSLPRTWLYVLLISIFAAFIIYTGKDHDLNKEVAKREREMLIDYPEIVSKLTLLIGSGLTLRAAFEKVALDYKNRTYGRTSFALEEMLITVYRMRSGVSEYEAYLDFGKRCSVKRYTKLGALFSQNIKKGSSGLLPELEKEVREAFEERKANARKRGEEAGTLLLLPMVLMLSVVMIIVIIPAFMSFSL